MEKRHLTPRNDEINKKLKAAIKTVASHYEEGAIDWLTMQEGSDWVQYWKQMDDSILFDSDGLLLRKIGWFEKTCVDMLKQYKLIREKQRQVGMF